MFSLNQSVLVRGPAGESLPSPFTGLTRLDVAFRRGEFSLVCAAGGTGKSLVALYLAVSHNTPCLYISADTTAVVQASRAVAMLTGDSVHGIRELITSGASVDAYQPVLDGCQWLRFCYNARPTPQDMETHLRCYRGVFGHYPQLVVVDNITNVDVGSGFNASDFIVGLEGLCDYLSEMARETGCHVLATHHVVGEYGSGDTPVPLSGVKGKITRVPSLILTLHTERGVLDERILNISPVKNREGRSDPTGCTYAQFQVDQENLRIIDLTGAV